MTSLAQITGLWRFPTLCKSSETKPWAAFLYKQMCCRIIVCRCNRLSAVETLRHAPTIFFFRMNTFKI